MKHRMAYVYMVRCKDDSLYTGIAKDLGHRMNEHYYKKKNGAKYTKSRQIQTLEMVWETEDWSLAARIEYRIKRLGREREIRTPAAAGAASGIHFSGRYRLRKMPAAPRLEAGDVYRSIESRSRK